MKTGRKDCYTVGNDEKWIPKIDGNSVSTETSELISIRGAKYTGIEQNCAMAGHLPG
jgi:hypothetical protein